MFFHGMCLRMYAANLMQNDYISKYNGCLQLHILKERCDVPDGNRNAASVGLYGLNVFFCETDDYVFHCVVLFFHALEKPILSACADKIMVAVFYFVICVAVNIVH